MIAIRAVAILCDELEYLVWLMFGSTWRTHRVTVFVFGRIYTGTGRPVCTHGLISILAKVKRLFGFIVMHALDHFWADEGAFCDNGFEGDEVV